MAEASAKRKLLQLLDRRVFNPILRASPRGYSEPERKILAQVQKKTERERERFHAYPDAAYVRRAFRADLRSQPAKKVNAELRRLDLPILADVKDEFEDTAEREGVPRSSGPLRKHPPHPPHPHHSKQAFEQIAAKRGRKAAEEAASRARAEERRAKRGKAKPQRGRSTGARTTRRASPGR